MEVDADVLHQGFDMTEYRKMLLKYAMGGEREWICAFSSHFMKRRLLVMTEHRKIQNFRLWLIVPMLLSALLCLGFTTKSVLVENETIAESEVTITGRVVDEQTGAPIPGVIVMEMGTTNGIITDLDGEFSLNTQMERELKFMMIDYETCKLQVNKSIEQPLEVKLLKAKE